MPIDPRMVKWDEKPAIPVGMVKWDEEPSMLDSIKQGAGNLAAGAVRGAGSIGATLVDLARSNLAQPVSDATPANMRPNVSAGLRDLPKGPAMRQGMDAGLQSMGAQPDSMLYQGGKLGAEIAGTAGVGGAMANGVRALSGTRAMSGLEPVTNAIARGLETGGFRAGELAGTGLGTATRIGTGAAVGGAAAGMVNPSDAGFGAAVGGALPGAAQLAGKAGNGIRSMVAGGGATPEVAALAARAKELGINIPADRLTNSRPMNALAAGLNYVPLSGRAATEDAMNSQLNKALSRTFGQDSSNVTQALRKADDVLGGQFDDFLRTNAVKVDQQFMTELAEASNQASRELGSDGASIIAKQVEDIIAKAGTGQIDGQAAYNIKKTLDRIGKRNSPEAWYAIDLKQKLMGALDRSVGQDKAAGFGRLRKQYGNMLSLEKLAKNGAEGEISVARLANMKNINNPQMQEIADIAAQFVKPREGAHGGAQRALVGAAAGFAGGLPGMAIGMGAGRGANMALNSEMARRFVLGGTGLLAEPQSMGLLTSGLRRTAPLLNPD